MKKLPTEPNIRLSLEEDFPLGVVAPDLHVYKVFEEFLNPIIKAYNYFDVNREFSLQPPTEFLGNGNEVNLDLDPHGDLVITGTGTFSLESHLSFKCSHFAAKFTKLTQFRTTLSRMSKFCYDLTIFLDQ